ncbi:MAG: serine/threonine protein kinase, partial [Acidobacteria bacterium]|nr:serine/threonine protein kinase [Acidobacteriota bacterium]
MGPFVLLEFLGEGGMGVVYLAEQTEPIQRRVALKLIKLGMDTREVIARFEGERQALALMNHPHIASVHDAGITREGRPYFVMAYVAGVPITAFCDSRRLDLSDRLELFLQTCSAIQHAHEKGIIHRDIKPSNVLVSEVDGKPSATVIDFGVAKATERHRTEATLLTREGVLVGTPEYMSPEQIASGGKDVDTRTDVYALGLLLYEILVGALPFDPGEKEKADVDEIRRRIMSEEPPKPSTRLWALPESGTDSARNRRTDPASLRRALRGDLDWIVMKALERDRSR